ncbi:MAG: hypothetical protein OXC93_03795 [Rhodospirillaceae bacterium]|nr:hypothetical protein [Rhodospirillaceae bacterium]
MNDPHVVALNYRIDHGDTIDYGRAESLDREEPGFRLTVKEGKARFELKEHYATEEDARGAVAEYIRVWEFDATLNYGSSDSFRLMFEDSEIIDRNPTAGRISITARFGAPSVSVAASVVIRPPDYPQPPSDIALNPDASVMHLRYLGYRGGHEPLGGMANFCLTVLEASTGKRPKQRSAAAKLYNVDERVLGKIGELSACKGGAAARKAPGLAKEFSAQERHFLEQALEAIIRRVAQRARTPDADLPKISWSDLPPIQRRT